ncbi:MAG: hypothetical protein IJ736_16825 [Firmicutes bacterium]|nr:hypothetical protein [Bacillota bacterium]
MLFVIFHLVSFWLGMESIISVNGLNAHDLFDFSDMNDFKKSVLIYCAKYCAEIIFFTGVLPYILSLILFIKAPFTKDIIPREYKKNGTSAEAIVAGKPDPSLLSRYKYIYVGVDYDIDKYGIISGEEDITEELNDKIYVLPHRYNLKNAQKVKILYIPEKKKCYLL